MPLMVLFAAFFRKDKYFRLFSTCTAVAVSVVCHNAVEVVVVAIRIFRKFHITIIDSAVLLFSEIAKHLSLPPVKLHCSMLAEDAIKAAVKDYEAKKAKMGQKGEDSPSEKAAEA